MATLVEPVGHVGPATLNDGTDGTQFRQGNEGQAIQSRLHGAHYENTKRGNVFIAATTPLGLAIPIYTATAPSVLLWNPSDSGRNVTLIRYVAAFASGSVPATGLAMGLSKIFGAGANIATGAVISAFAASTPINGLLNAGNQPKAKVSTAGTNTITAGVAADFFYPMFGMGAFAAATTTADPFALIHDFEGAIVLPPGTAIWPSGTVASVALFVQSIIWEETPITL
jgi:hypothetical protein